MAKDSSILFFHEDTTFQLKDRTIVRTWLKKVAKKEGFSIVGLNYIFCSDEYLLQINKDFLDHDYYTDIITFDQSEVKGKIEGDIFISIDRVKDNAKTEGSTFKQELHRVLAHGVLHLTGYKDKTPKDAKKMRVKEEEALKLLKPKA
ncbi:MAG: rRNA maturation RNase YbeY [Cytophagaceae bacterium]